MIELGRSEDSIVPTAVLPFAIPRDRAGSLFVAWLGKRWFAPSDLTRRAAREGLDGVYLPYWTYDSDTTTAYRGERGDYYYVSESYRDAQGNQRTRQVRRTRWSFASGTIYLEFDDVLVCATPSLPGPLVDKLEPWDLGSLRPFDGKYLAGFMAERYRVDLEAGFQRAEQRMEPRIRDAIRADIGGDEQRIGSMKVRHEHVTFKHVLLPLWLSAFRYRDRVFRVSINARTGEVSGERPWSWVKITLLVLAIVAAIVGIIWLAHRG
ncbi:MAG: hypothetical protein KBG28_13310 [Kofleriaceae bacterium]|nr:hypothetical protein [Kofleriaceae bacterium]